MPRRGALGPGSGRRQRASRDPRARYRAASRFSSLTDLAVLIQYAVMPVPSVTLVVLAPLARRRWVKRLARLRFPYPAALHRPRSWRGAVSRLGLPPAAARLSPNRRKKSRRDVSDDTVRRGSATHTLAGRATRPSARRRPDRDLRLRVRRPHRGQVGHRPAPARVGALPGRHRAPALRPQADRRGPRVRPRVPRPPQRAGRQGAGDRLQLRERGDAARRPRALRRPGGRGDPPGHPPRGRREPDRPDRRHLHAGDHRSRWPTRTPSPRHPTWS